MVFKDAAGTMQAKIDHANKEKMVLISLQNILCKNNGSAKPAVFKAPSPPPLSQVVAEITADTIGDALTVYLVKQFLKQEAAQKKITAQLAEISGNNLEEDEDEDSSSSDGEGDDDDSSSSDEGEEEPAPEVNVNI